MCRRTEAPVYWWGEKWANSLWLAHILYTQPSTHKRDWHYGTKYTVTYCSSSATGWALSSSLCPVPPAHTLTLNLINCLILMWFCQHCFPSYPTIQQLCPMVLEDRAGNTSTNTHTRLRGRMWQQQTRQSKVLKVFPSLNRSPHKERTGNQKPTATLSFYLQWQMTRTNKQHALWTGNA